MNENLDDYDPFNVDGRAQYTPDETMRSLVETTSVPQSKANQLKNKKDRKSINKNKQ